ncbi:hypothetical protein EON65_24590, partial [archaeon]
MRLKALTLLLTYAHTHLSTLHLDTLKGMCDRVVDKKSHIRKAALGGLAKLYHQYITSHILPISPIQGAEHATKKHAHTHTPIRTISDLTHSIAPEVLERVGGVPSLLIKSWGYPDIHTKHLVVALLQEMVLGGG